MLCLGWLPEGIHIVVCFYLSKHSVSTRAPMSITFSPRILAFGNNLSFLLNYSNSLLES
ncbi:hypothetical protein HanOQP8_Chr03g0089821 [Helianthus annuus]|nr:hypothetical protein HanIR_Chr03g0100411 [Helianthus annuus]KAJ0772653.1 hypothetical protein HanOQP8_Chr03g0089821 [Helianthus annuus]